jgi:UDP-N-acetylglucosamine:LPS N-acetylglucosamine transferase
MMKVSKATILILTTHTGGGHMNLAQALKETLETHYEVVILDPQSPLVGRSYTAASRHFVKYLEWLFIFTDIKFVSFCLQRFLALMSSRRFRSIIERVQPQLVIATHAMLSYTTARAIDRLPRHIPLVFQLTDLGRLNMTWFAEKKADAYLAPTKEILEQALGQGIEQHRLHLTGRPIRHQFLEVSPDMRSETLASLGFDPSVFTLFLQGGAMGSARVDRAIEGVLSTGTPVQIILASGDNNGLTEHYAGSEHVRVLPFTEKIAPYMAAADVIAGKAGASFVSEAFILEKPFLVTAFIPGQETPNLHFIERHNLGWVCLQTAEQIELLCRLASNPDLIAEKTASIRAYKTWNIQANQHILPTIDRLLEIPSVSVGRSRQSGRLSIRP